MRPWAMYASALVIGMFAYYVLKTYIEASLGVKAVLFVMTTCVYAFVLKEAQRYTIKPNDVYEDDEHDW